MKVAHRREGCARGMPAGNEAEERGHGRQDQPALTTASRFRSSHTDTVSAENVVEMNLGGVQADPEVKKKQALKQLEDQEREVLLETALCRC